MKPLTWDLWVTSACSFVFIGFVVWVLEHRMNRSFRGPPSHQIGTSLWFSFSIMVFSHRKYHSSITTQHRCYYQCMYEPIISKAKLPLLGQLVHDVFLEPLQPNDLEFNPCCISAHGKCVAHCPLCKLNVLLSEVCPIHNVKIIHVSLSNDLNFCDNQFMTLIVIQSSKVTFDLFLAIV